MKDGAGSDTRKFAQGKAQARATGNRSVANDPYRGALPPNWAWACPPESYDWMDAAGMSPARYM